jgi:hypothetical protein
MIVNVFVTGVDHALKAELLVLPERAAESVPDKFTDGWTYFATVDTFDSIFGEIDGRAIELEMSASGFAVVQTAAPEGRR